MILVFVNSLLVFTLSLNSTINDLNPLVALRVPCIIAAATTELDFILM